MPETTEQPQPAFFIAPIGEARSRERIQSDTVLEVLVRPACREIGYEIIRADELNEPGSITEQVVNRLLDAKLVIADISGRNPNVLYEVALCHAKPVPLVIIGDEHSLPAPFDIAPNRVLQYKSDEVAGMKDLIPKLHEFIRHAAAQPGVDSPVRHRLYERRSQSIESSEFDELREEIRFIARLVLAERQPPITLGRALIGIPTYPNYAPSQPASISLAQGTPLPDGRMPLTAQVTDTFGSPVPEVAVAFLSPRGSPTDMVVLTDSRGVAETALSNWSGTSVTAQVLIRSDKPGFFVGAGPSVRIDLPGFRVPE